MHRSRVGVLLLDHSEGHDEALAFWAGAVGAEPRPSDEPQYTVLGHLGTLELAVQRTGAGTPARVHLDFETDDVAAEVARLVGLGARVVEDRDQGYSILQDPGGLVFCVVPVQDAELFEAHATTWE
jgi:glyoxalase superfamily protein